MATRLSAHFRQRRFQLGLRLGEVARRMGYTSIAGAANKIILFEERGDIRPDLFDKLKTALEIDDATVERLIEEDRREFVQRWNEWANQPIEPHLVIRAIPGFYINEPLPEGLESPDDMERYAAESAKDRHKKLWLVLSRRLSATSRSWAGRSRPVTSATSP